MQESERSLQSLASLPSPLKHNDAFTPSLKFQQKHQYSLDSPSLRSPATVISVEEAHFTPDDKEVSVCEGTLSLSVDDIGAVQQLRKSISEVLEVECENVEVSVDENGRVNYRISGTSAEEVEQILQDGDQENEEEELTKKKLAPPESSGHSLKESDCITKLDSKEQAQIQEVGTSKAIDSKPNEAQEAYDNVEMEAKKESAVETGESEKETESNEKEVFEKKVEENTQKQGNEFAEATKNEEDSEIKDKKAEVPEISHELTEVNSESKKKETGAPEKLDELASEDLHVVDSRIPSPTIIEKSDALEENAITTAIEVKETSVAKEESESRAQKDANSKGEDIKENDQVDVSSEIQEVVEKLVADVADDQSSEKQAMKINIRTSCESSKELEKEPELQSSSEQKQEINQNKEVKTENMQSSAVLECDKEENSKSEQDFSNQNREETIEESGQVHERHITDDFQVEEVDLSEPLMLLKEATEMPSLMPIIDLSSESPLDDFDLYFPTLLTAPSSDTPAGAPLILENELQLLQLPGNCEERPETIPILGKALNKTQLVERLMPLLTKEELIAVLAEKQKNESSMKTIGTSPMHFTSSEEVFDVDEFILPTLLEAPQIEKSDACTQMKIPLYRPPPAAKALEKPLFTTTFTQSIQPEIYRGIKSDFLTLTTIQNEKPPEKPKTQTASDVLEKSLHMTRQLQDRIKQLRGTHAEELELNSSSNLTPAKDTAYKSITFSSNLTPAKNSSPKKTLSDSLKSSPKFQRKTLEQDAENLRLQIEDGVELPSTNVMTPPANANLQLTNETINTTNASFASTASEKQMTASATYEKSLFYSSSLIPSDYRRPKKKSLNEEVTSLNASLGNMDKQIARLQLLSENLEKEFDQDRDMLQNHQVNTIADRLQHLESRSFQTTGKCNSARYIATKIRDELRCLHSRASSPSSTPTRGMSPRAVRSPSASKLAGSVKKKKRRARNMSKQKKMRKARNLINSIYLDS